MSSGLQKQYLCFVLPFLSARDVSRCYVFRCDVWKPYWYAFNSQRVRNYEIACILREKKLNTVYMLERVWRSTPSKYDYAVLQAVSVLEPAQWQWIMLHNFSLALRAQRALQCLPASSGVMSRKLCQRASVKRKRTNLFSHCMFGGRAVEGR